MESEIPEAIANHGAELITAAASAERAFITAHTAWTQRRDMAALRTLHAAAANLTEALGACVTFADALNAPDVHRHHDAPAARQ